MKARPTLRQLRANLPANVTVLPTAAPRQVQQPMNRQGRMARQALRDETGKRFAFRSPGEREAERHATMLREAGKTPALVLAHAILCEMDHETRARVIHRLACSGDETVRLALEVAQTTMLTVGQKLDLMRALDGEPATHCQKQA